MRRIPLTVIVAVVVASACVLAAAGCGIRQTNAAADEGNRTVKAGSASMAPDDRVDISGTIVFKNLEGGFYAIEGDDGRLYDPINLPETFKRDGLRVNVDAKFRNDAVGTHMVGPIIEIVHITAE